MERVTGQVDRLAVTGDAVLIGDYKTDRLVPSGLDEVPAAYLAQLALYRAVMSRHYPDKTVRAALIFTNAPVLMEMPVDELEAGLGRSLRTGGNRERHAAVKVS